MGLQPLETFGCDIVHWLNHEPDSSEPLRVVDNYPNLVENIRQPASNPILDIHIHKYSEINSLLLMDLEPRCIQDLIHEAIYESGPNRFVGVRQATLYAILFCSGMTFGKVRKLRFKNVNINESSVTFQFTEENRCSLRPDYLYFQEKMCPFRLNVCYLSL